MSRIGVEEKCVDCGATIITTQENQYYVLYRCPPCDKISMEAVGKSFRAYVEACKGSPVSADDLADAEKAEYVFGEGQKFEDENQEYASSSTQFDDKSLERKRRADHAGF